MKNILLVDDEPWLTESLSAALESREFHCITASDMSQGVEATLQKHEICALMTDVMMPPGLTFPNIEASEAGFSFH